MKKILFSALVVLVAHGPAAMATEPEPAFTEAETQYWQELFDQDPDGGVVEQVRSRLWTCWARDRHGRSFSGTSSSASVARRLAMNRCISRSNSCSLRGCN